MTLNFILYFDFSSAYDNVRKERVAIKKISRPFATNVHAKRAFRGWNFFV
jgi:hypothetical protein